ncbi:MAG TPA: LEA type 2 family protein [Chitinophagaceae bacterium]
MRLFLFPILIILLAGCAKPQGFDYRDIRNFKVEKLGFNKSTVSMDLVYYNPNNFGVQLRKVDCDVYINEKFLGKYLLDTVMTIPRKAEFTLPSRMEVDMKNVFRNTLSVLVNKDVLVKVKGTTRVGKGSFFINVPVDYEGRHEFELFD